MEKLIQIGRRKGSKWAANGYHEFCRQRIFSVSNLLYFGQLKQISGWELLIEPALCHSKLQSSEEKTNSNTLVLKDYTIKNIFTVRESR